MTRAKLGTDNAGTQYVHFYCPGCAHAHGITVGKWTWNGSLDAPTFTPSLLCHPHDIFVDGSLEGDALIAPENITSTPRCHSFITDGRIQFLEDSTHHLAGKTVEIPEWPYGSWGSLDED